MTQQKSLFKKSLFATIFLVGLILLLAILWLVVSQPLFSSVSPNSVVPIDQARLERHVRMLSETFVPRDWAHPANLDRVAGYIKNEFYLTGGAVSEQTYSMEGSVYRNPIVTFGPGTAERIVVGAHYDAFGPYPAADDNASGVAGLIELAYLLGKSSLPIRVDLVAFTLEEPKTAGTDGLFRSSYGGSAVHAKSLKNERARVRLMVALEMLGYFSDKDQSQGYPSPFMRLAYPSAGNFVLVVGRPSDWLSTRRVKALMRSASAVPVYSINAPASLEGIDWSDHFNYWKVGYPAVMITDTAMNRNRHYHTKEDTPERLDFRRMAKTIEGVYAAVLGTAADAEGH